MKRKIALILAAVLTIASANGTLAASSNSLNKTRTVKDGATITDVYLKIVPTSQVETGDTIVLSFSNAEVLYTPNFSSLQGNGNSFTSLKNNLYNYGAKATLDDLWGKISDNYIPWEMTKSGNTMVEVELFPIPSAYCGERINGSTPYYYIPLNVTAKSKDGTKNITVTVDSNETSITSGTYIFGYMPLEGTSTTVDSTDSSSSEETTAAADEETEATTEADVSEEKESLNVSVQIGSSSIAINDTEYSVDAAAYIQADSSSTLVPLRFVALALCAGDVEDADESSAIKWDAETKTAIIAAGSSVVEFTAGSDTYVIDGVSYELENGVKAEITDGRMYVPFRALGNALGAEVSWDAETKTASYTMEQ
ncbi:MAG: copper amine oxidase N-terminal domain-containing protein [Clostridiales bacterium]|nr:copper amine oxidase N-terminal domain-containing protein [Clostridiales bacterium]